MTEADDPWVGREVPMTESASTNPFLRYRWLLGVDREAVASGMPDEDFCRLVAKLDTALVELDGKGFEAPPSPIASEIGLEVSTHTDLINIDYGKWEGLTQEQAAASHPEAPRRGGNRTPFRCRACRRVNASSRRGCSVRRRLPTDILGRTLRAGDLGRHSAALVISPI